ncbi:hypothetical protein GFK82_00401 [Candidatus Steffania adelgidicola]|nr:hypothetical protein GFK82_00401 [Candidatus Steffania adelgidicola]
MIIDDVVAGLIVANIVFWVLHEYWHVYSILFKDLTSSYADLCSAIIKILLIKVE